MRYRPRTHISIDLRPVPSKLHVIATTCLRSCWPEKHDDSRRRQV